MTKREKVLITVTVLATSASVSMFAFVSLAHFLKSSPNVAPPIVSKMYGNTVDQLATLEPIPLTAGQTTSSTDSATNQPSSTMISTEVSKVSEAPAHSSRYSAKNETQVKQLIENSVEIKIDPKQLVTTVLNEVGIDPKLFRLKL